MKDRFRKGGLVVKDRGKDDSVHVLLQPGVSYVPRAAVEKYGTEFFKKLSRAERIVVVVDPFQEKESV